MLENKQLVLLCFAISILTMLSAIIIPEIFRVPYSFYNIVKLFAFSSLGYIAYYLFKQKEIIPSFLVLVSVILYNPLSPIYLTRNIWIVVDIFIILILIFSFFKINKQTPLIDNKVKLDEECIVSQELNKLQDYLKTNCTNYKEKHKLLKVIGITLGDFNEHFIEKLCNEKKINSCNTVFESIKYLANNNYYHKDIINDLHSLNDVRNRIIHDKDRTPILEDNIEYFLDMAKSSIRKATFLHKNSIK